ncbi:MAG: YdeI/OmpD-associated family protein [Spirochaetaceae bacterium]
MRDPIFFKNQVEFNSWLEEHADDSELWVGYFKKSTGQATLTWSESVDVALCFGWIDGIRKTVDDKRYKIRFTPRKVTSVWSAINVNKVIVLIELGKMRPEGLDLFNKRTDKLGYTSDHRNIPLSSEYEEQLKANKQSWLFFSNLASSYKRESIWWVMSAKRVETQLKRLGILIASSEEGLKIPSLRKKL